MTSPKRDFIVYRIANIWYRNHFVLYHVLGRVFKVLEILKIMVVSPVILSLGRAIPHNLFLMVGSGVGLFGVIFPWARILSYALVRARRAG